jgi:hypothetical protein
MRYPFLVFALLLPLATGCIARARIHAHGEARTPDVHEVDVHEVHVHGHHRVVRTHDGYVVVDGNDTVVQSGAGRVVVKGGRTVVESADGSVIVIDEAAPGE